eukprot:CAMPEP_0114990798 /NCGR_PEP_ID=MMETSP0216-20121206/11006_1 /TAXON_ID=223996 /ORGANISM="Protocruzia adherens, Strain Boccale" /LENGTH=113 /DNA_ID=CAMNT_0002354033 /DNA_START=215 /DNA_END=556 /DNA_ORIENTATION=+
MEPHVEDEIKEYNDFGYVKSFTITKHTDTYALLDMVTLEDISGILEWSTQNGIKVRECSNEDYIFKKYDSFEQLLTEISPGYCSKFQNNLFDKLTALKNEETEEEEEEEEEEE